MTNTEIPEGVTRWRTKQGVTVVRVHYTSDPAKRAAAWMEEQKRGISEAMWEREMEINFRIMLGKAWFPEFRYELHVAKESLRPFAGKPVIRGWDYGLTPCTVFAQYGPKGELVVLQEVQSVDCGITAHAKVVEAESAAYAGLPFVDVGDPAGRQRAQSDETSCTDILREQYGIYVQDGPVSAVRRWEAVRQRLTTVTETGGPMLLMDPRCQWLIGGVHGRVPPAEGGGAVPGGVGEERVQPYAGCAGVYLRERRGNAAAVGGCGHSAGGADVRGSDGA